MKKLYNNISRVLCALLLCAGCIMFAGCTDDPLGDGENTEQGGNNGGGGSGESVSPVSVSLGKVTATTVRFDMTLDLKAMSQYEEAGLIFSSVDDLDISAETATIFQINRESYSNVFTGLTYNTKYYYTTYLKKGTFYLYGDKKEFTTPDVLLELSAGSITATSAQITGIVEGLSESDKSQIEVGMLYSSEAGKVEKGEGTKLTASEISSDNTVSFALSDLTFGTTYYYCSYVKQGDGYVYGEVKEFVAGSVSVNLSAGSITATTAQITGIVEGLSESDKSLIEVGMLYSSEAGKVEKGEGTKLTASEIPSDNAISFDLSDLIFGTKYYYCSYVKQGESCIYGEVKEFVAGSVTVNLSAGSITATSAQITGSVDGLSESDKSLIEVGMFYSSEAGKVENGQGTKLTATEIPSDNAVSFDLEALTFGTKYYYCSYVKQGDGYVYGEVKTFDTIFEALNLSATSTANCYIITESGLYKFKAVKGNSTTSVGSVASASVLWESFGTSTVPSVGDLIKSVSYKDGYIGFQTADTFKEGSAVIAAKNSSGTILWSWHIWFTGAPKGQTYYNNAGTMMDRNLGATIASTGYVGALGLLYQWGRKDPFLGSSSISSSTLAKSTITWPSAVSSDSSNGTIEYATSHPTTFITCNSSNYDWYYTGTSSTDNTRWTTSDKPKSIYDPCPAGWRVPDGGSNGVWSKALGSSASVDYTYSSSKGGNFTDMFGSGSTIWYPASGYRGILDGALGNVGFSGNYWSASPYSRNARYLHFHDYVYPSYDNNRAYGYSVRCLQE
ncbi:MAG: hypothetical protein IKB00_04105 [Bacteroidaceae bacterium]|nr:hypothetical protein [Bacteroidaceae bacterium]